VLANVLKLAKPDPEVCPDVYERFHSGTPYMAGDIPLERSEDRD
jgi:hypothetical protein